MTQLLNEPAAGDLQSMTKAQLLEYAEEQGIGGVSSEMRKAEIYAAIVAAESE